MCQLPVYDPYALHVVQGTFGVQPGTARHGRALPRAHSWVNHIINIVAQVHNGSLYVAVAADVWVSSGTMWTKTTLPIVYRYNPGDPRVAWVTEARPNSSVFSTSNNVVASPALVSGFVTDRTAPQPVPVAKLLLFVAARGNTANGLEVYEVINVPPSGITIDRASSDLLRDAANPSNHVARWSDAPAEGTVIAAEWVPFRYYRIPAGAGWDHGAYGLGQGDNATRGLIQVLYSRSDGTTLYSRLLTIDPQPQRQKLAMADGGAYDLWSATPPWHSTWVTASSLASVQTLDDGDAVVQDVSIPATGGGALLFHGHTLYGAVTDFAEQVNTAWSGEVDYVAFPPAQQRRELVCSYIDIHNVYTTVWNNTCTATDLNNFVYVYHGIDGVFEAIVRAPDDQDLLGQLQALRFFNHVRNATF